MIKAILECKSCGYTWYPDRAKWFRNTNLHEIDCPNPKCQNYGTSSHPASKDNWHDRGEINSDDW